jgi:hypothetical protein
MPQNQKTPIKPSAHQKFQPVETFNPEVIKATKKS